MAELAIGLCLLSIFVLIWSTFVIYCWRQEKVRRKIAEAECEMYKDLLINRIANGKEDKTEES